MQKILGNTAGDFYCETTADDVSGRFAASTVKDSATGTLYIKLVNGEEKSRAVKIQLKGATGLNPQASKLVIGGSDPNKVNAGRADADGEILPVTSTQRVGTSFEVKLDPCSLTVIRIPAK